MRRLVAQGLLWGIAAALLVGLPAGAAGGVGGRPANPDPNNPRTQSIFIMELAGGAAKKDTAAVVNASDKTQTVRVYAVDGVVTSSGDFTCRQDSEARTDVGSWVQVGKDQVTVDSNQTQNVDFTVTVPANADVGEHNGCVVFQTVDEEATQASSGVRIHARQAVRLVVTVPGDLHRDITISQFTVDRKNDAAVYNVGMKNVGNVSADVDSKVVVQSLWGSEVFTAGAGYPVLANNQLNARFEQNAAPMFGGWYWAQATISYGNEAGKFGATAAASAITKQSERKLIYLAPTTTGAMVLIVAAVLAAGAIAYVVRRRQYLNNVHKNGRGHVVQAGDTIQSVAQQHGVSWRRLAAVNKIKAPYVLKTGTALRVPTKKK